MQPATLLLDLDGVLRLWPTDYATLEQEHGLPAGSVATAAFESALLGDVITGRISDQEWRNEVSRKLALAYPFSKAKAAVAAWSLPVGAVHHEVLHLVNLARSKCVVGLVTNATDRLLCDLADLGLTEHLDFIVNSSEVGFAKPSPEIFKHALAMAGAEPDEAVFVDDSASNVSAAAALGIGAHHFRTVAGLGTFMQSVGLLTNAA